jgi:hypothetical protein
MKTKLSEALWIVNELTADVEGRYPVGLLRIRRLLTEAISEWDEMVGDRVALAGEEMPMPAA